VKFNFANEEYVVARVEANNEEQVWDSLQGKSTFRFTNSNKVGTRVNLNNVNYITVFQEN
jgi:hypothetical protein